MAIAMKIARIKLEIEPYLAQIAKLEEEHALLFDRPADEEEVEVPPPPKKKQKPQPQPKRTRAGSTADRIMAFYAAHQRECTIDDLAEAIPSAKRPSLLGALVLLNREGRIVRVKHGVYGPAVVNNVTPLLGGR